MILQPQFRDVAIAITLSGLLLSKEMRLFHWVMKVLPLPRNIFAMSKWVQWGKKRLGFDFPGMFSKSEKLGGSCIYIFLFVLFSFSN